MSSWHSYPDIFNLGHKAVADLTLHDLNVECKIDGSQVSFGLIDGELRIRSKGQEMCVDAPEKMFTLAAETVKALAGELHPEWTYRGEFLRTPKHNALAYSRVPRRNIILFDINTDEETYLGYEAKQAEAARLGLECVPLLHVGHVTLENIRGFLDRESILGGTKIEGVVLKPVNYDIFGQNRKVLMGKFVSEAFKEVRASAWKSNNPTGKDVIQLMIDRLKTPARWEKAIQHLREAGQLENNPCDIGPLLKEIQSDIEKECKELILETLWNHFWPQIRRGVIRGFPEHYKNALLERQFQKDEQPCSA